MGSTDSYRGAGEARRINVVYFLSRGGRTEHPHLIRVNHLHHPAVRLHDVKRWLSELRGKDMPDAFSWSYKRKYKAGYVWQDLVDDDLITPVCDNEYVLKGCDLSPPTSQKPSDHQKVETAGVGAQRPSDEVCVEAGAEEASPEPPPVDQDSSGETARRAEALNSGLPLRPAAEEKAVTRAATAAARREERPGKPVGRSRSMRVSQVLQSILSCGAIETNDAALRPVQRPRMQGSGGRGDDWRTPRCPGIDGCGFQKGRSRRGGSGNDGGRRGGGGKDAGVAHKPVGEPYCSQCGKAFRPEKLHSHMKSCKVFKERMKASTNRGTEVSRRPESRSRDFSNDESSGSPVFLLTQS